MKIIISPAKKMNIVENDYSKITVPCFSAEMQELFQILKSMDQHQLQTLWNCSDKIAEDNFRKLKMIEQPGGLTPALLSYEGIQYQYMAPSVFTDKQWSYVNESLRILSGFYGLLRPSDGVLPYRLEMQARLKIGDKKNLYEYWSDKIYKELVKNDDTIINLASDEYGKTIKKFLDKNIKYITCIFGEEISGKVKVKGTLAKMARGEMVRYIAENEITKAEQIKDFNRQNYCFSEKLSSQDRFVFLKKSETVSNERN